MSDGASNQKQGFWQQLGVGVTVGVILTVVAAVFASSAPFWWDDVFGSGGSRSGSTTTVSPPTTRGSTTVTTRGSTTSGPAGCQVTVSNPFLTLSDKPSHDSTQSVKVPPGTYAVQSTTTTRFAGVDERWYQITVGSRQGWILDNPVFIDAKSDAC